LIRWLLAPFGPEFRPRVKLFDPKFIAFRHSYTKYWVIHRQATDYAAFAERPVVKKGPCLPRTLVKISGQAPGRNLFEKREAKP
jgi:hypothetical protein